MESDFPSGGQQHVAKIYSRSSTSPRPTSWSLIQNPGDLVARFEHHYFRENTNDYRAFGHARSLQLMRES